MPTAVEEAAAVAAQERAVFDDSGDADDSDGADSEETSDDDSAEDAVAAKGAAAPPSQPAAATPSPPPSMGPPSSFDAAVSNPDPVSGTPLSVAAPQNGNGSTAVAAVNDAVDGAVVSAVAEERRPVTLGYDESRRLFQRLWTDDDEIKILQGFLDFTTARGTAFASHQYDTGPFYEDIKKQLQLEFSKNQLIEKLRRLKKKYRNCVGRMNAAGDGFAFRSTHEKAIFDIARNIWNPSVKRSHDSDDDDINAGAANSGEIFTVPVNEGPLSCDRGFSRSRRRSKRRHTVEPASLALPPPPAAAAAAPAPVAATAPETTPRAADNSGPATCCTPLEAVAGLPSMVEETMKVCLSPLFKELINSAITNPLGPGVGGGQMLNIMLPLGLGSSPMPVTGTAMDEKWRAQQILELEVYLKRIEFVRDQVKAKLEDLKSSSSR